jgi:hypothetical protein
MELASHAMPSYAKSHHIVLLSKHLSGMIATLRGMNSHLDASLRLQQRSSAG